MAGRIPPPVPTAKGVRSAADPVLAELIDRSVRIPELKLPPQSARSEPYEISYGLLVNRETESVRGFLRSVREFGAVRIGGHGILTEELRVALAKSERIFTVDCCTSYGDHEQLEWDGGGDSERRIAGDAAAAVGEQNYQILR